MSKNFQSLAMKFARCVGLHSVAWSLRRLYVPVSKSALVLEVGSGGNPYFRSNVLIDAYENTRERHFVGLVSDRPTVLGFGENLPFKDKAFDFVIASHVLEHSADPDRFLSELERVAKAGYIEVPDAFMERLNPYLDHRLEITVRENGLVISKKKSWQIDPDLVEKYEQRAQALIARKVIPSFPFEFHVRFFWENTIKRRIVNPEVDASWPAPELGEGALGSRASLRAKINSSVLKAIRKVFSQNSRNRNIDIFSLLQCPSCRQGGVSRYERGAICDSCGAKFEIIDGIPRLFSSVGEAR